MFDKMVTVNYRRGLGGEFFCYMLDKAQSDREFEEDTSFGTRNRFEYVGINFVFQTFVHHFFTLTFGGYKTAEEYAAVEFGYPDKFTISLRYKPSIRNMDRLIKYYDMFIRDEDPYHQLLNIKQYIEVECKHIYDTYMKETNDRLGICNIHFNSANEFNLPLKFFYEESKNVSIVNNNIHEYFYTLLWIYKRLPALKYYPAVMKSSIFKHSKQSLTEYFKFEERKEYKVFDGEFKIEAFDLHYRGLNVDRDLSDYLGVKVKFDYDRIKHYAHTNRMIILENFGLDIFREYDLETVYRKFAEYVDRIYDQI